MKLPHIPRPHFKSKKEKVVVKYPDLSGLATKDDIASIVKRLDTVDKQKVWQMMSPRLKSKIVKRVLELRGENATRKKS